MGSRIGLITQGSVHELCGSNTGILHGGCPDLTSVGSAISEATAAAAAPTINVVAAASDEVSAAIAALFGEHAQRYQALIAQAAQFHAQFVTALIAGGGAYAQAEAANVAQSVLDLINARTRALVGRPLIGNGANGIPGTGQTAATAASWSAMGGPAVPEEPPSVPAVPEEPPSVPAVPVGRAEWVDCSARAERCSATAGPAAAAAAPVRVREGMGAKAAVAPCLRQRRSRRHGRDWRQGRKLRGR
ncbi:hypothetical protein B1T48_02290 [Mycobacterium persicum]|nr:hypothetical protein B1T48_02290 [Mycobacterium persicum]